MTLSISSREGVEIDFCPQCRGVWLDRGELDKVIERAGAVLAAARTLPPEESRLDREYREPERDRPRDRDHRDRDRYDDDRYRGSRKKKKGFDFLEDLFDL